MKSDISIRHPPLTQHSRLADLNLLAVAVIWGVNMSVMKHAINQVDPFSFNAIRLTLSAITLGFCAWLENKNARSSGHNQSKLEIPEGRRSKFYDWSMIGLFSLLTGAVYQIIFVVGMDRTTAGNTALIMSSVPMWTAVLSFFILSEKLRGAWLGVLITFAGTVIITLQKGFSVESEYFWGNNLILIAALAWALGAVVSRPMLKRISPIRLAFYATSLTLPLHFLMPFLTGGSFEHLADPGVVMCWLFSGIFSTGLAYAMWNLGVKQLGASAAAVYQNFVPLVAIFVSWQFLDESITLIQIIGGVMIIAGLLVTRKLRPQNT